MMINFQKIVELLTEQNKTIATMESCTGGAIANEITNIEGASEVIRFSAITYSNEFKIKMGVSDKIIKKYTVYSNEVAETMSKAICDFSESDYGIGITGKLNRVDKNNLYGKNNTVFISIYDKLNNIFIAKEISVNGKSRKENKEIIIISVITMLEEILEN